MKICVLDSTDVHPDLRFGAERLADFNPSIFNTASALLAEAPDCDILLTNTKLDLTAAKARMPSLDWVQVVSAGVEAYLPSLPPNVTLTNASGVHAEKGAEFILAGALMLNYRIPGFMADRDRKIWAQNFVRPLRGKHALILGAGSIGTAGARLLKERGMRISFVTRSGKADFPAEQVLTFAGLAAVLPTADLLINTLPSTPETRGKIGTAELALLPDGAGIVSVGRAAVFDEMALGAELERERLAGLVTDVFHREPLSEDDPAWTWPLTIATPHCSVDDHEGYIDRCLDIFRDNLDRRANGQPLRNVVDRASGY